MTQKTFLTILGILLLFPCLLHAEMLTGTVVSMDREAGQLLLHMDSEQAKEVLVNTDISLPPCVHEGGIVRAWGSFSEDDVTFIATDVRGPGRKFHNDATGVRARINQSLGHGPCRPCRCPVEPADTIRDD